MANVKRCGEMKLLLLVFLLLAPCNSGAIFAARPWVFLPPRETTDAAAEQGLTSNSGQQIPATAQSGHDIQAACPHADQALCSTLAVEQVEQQSDTAAVELAAVAAASIAAQRVAPVSDEADMASRSRGLTATGTTPKAQQRSTAGVVPKRSTNMQSMQSSKPATKKKRAARFSQASTSPSPSPAAAGATQEAAAAMDWIGRMSTATVVIAAPANRQSFPANTSQGATVRFSSDGTQPELGGSLSAYSWAITGISADNAAFKQTAEGPNATLTLPPGSYSVTLSVVSSTDVGNETITDTVQRFTVEPFIGGPSPTPPPAPAASSGVIATDLTKPPGPPPGTAPPPDTAAPPATTPSPLPADGSIPTTPPEPVVPSTPSTPGVIPTTPPSGVTPGGVPGGSDGSIPVNPVSPQAAPPPPTDTGVIPTTPPPDATGGSITVPPSPAPTTPPPLPPPPVTPPAPVTPPSPPVTPPPPPVTPIPPMVPPVVTPPAPPPSTPPISPPSPPPAAPPPSAPLPPAPPGNRVQQCVKSDYELTNPDDWNDFAQCCKEATAYPGANEPDCLSMPPKPATAGSGAPPLKPPTPPPTPPATPPPTPPAVPSPPPAGPAPTPPSGKTPEFFCTKSDYDMNNSDDWDYFKMCCDDAKADGWDLAKYYPDCVNLPPRPPDSGTNDDGYRR